MATLGVNGEVTLLGINLHATVHAASHAANCNERVTSVSLECAHVSPARTLSNDSLKCGECFCPLHAHWHNQNHMLWKGQGTCPPGPVDDIFFASIPRSNLQNTECAFSFEPKFLPNRESATKTGLASFKWKSQFKKPKPKG